MVGGQIDIESATSDNSPSYPQTSDKENENGGQSLVPANMTSSENWLKQMRLRDTDDLKRAKEEAKVRTRIRSRITVDGNDWRDELENEISADAIAKPLITAEDILAIRKEGWMPDGVNVCKPGELTMGYDTAWNIGKRGCVACKLSGDYDLRIGPNKLRFFVMDGTDVEKFLSYYTKPDALVEKGEVSEKKGYIRASDLKMGFWNFGKRKVRITRSDGSGGVRVLENFPERFYQAMIVCLREMEIYARVEALKQSRLALRQDEMWRHYLRRRQQRDNKLGTNNSQNSGPSNNRSSVSVMRGGTSTARHTVIEIPTFTNIKDDVSPHKRCASEFRPKAFNMTSQRKRSIRGFEFIPSPGTILYHSSDEDDMSETSTDVASRPFDDVNARSSTTSANSYDLRGAAPQRIFVTAPPE